MFELPIWAAIGLAWGLVSVASGALIARWFCYLRGRG